MNYSWFLKVTRVFHCQAPHIVLRSSPLLLFHCDFSLISEDERKGKHIEMLLWFTLMFWNFAVVSYISVHLFCRLFTDPSGPQQLFPIRPTFIPLGAMISQRRVVTGLRDPALILILSCFSIWKKTEISKSANLSLCPVYMKISQVHQFSYGLLFETYISLEILNRHAIDCDQ